MEGKEKKKKGDEEAKKKQRKKDCQRRATLKIGWAEFKYFL
jgi:hypothetical protein